MGGGGRNAGTHHFRVEPGLVRWTETAIVVAAVAIFAVAGILRAPVSAADARAVVFGGGLAFIVLSILVARRFASETFRRVLLVVYIFTLCGIAIAVVGPRIGVGAGLMAAVVVATVLLGRPGVIGSAVAIFAMLTLAAVAFVHGWIPRVGWDQRDFGGWLRMALVCGVVALLVGLGSSEIAKRLEIAFRRTVRTLSARRQEQTERRIAQRALLVTARAEALGRLAGGIAHDVNNSLAVILANAELLEARIDLTGDDRQLVTAMIEAARRAARTTRDVLAFGRGAAPLGGTVSLAEIVPQLGEFLARIVPETITLDVRGRSERHVVANSDALHQLVLFCALEMVDALGRAGDISIRFEDAGDRAHIIVRGEGRELAPISTQSPSWVAISTTVARCEGTVELVQGERLAEITLVLGAADDPGVPSPAPPVAREARIAATRVLVVDDEAPVRRAIARVVRRAGYEVVEAHDGASARDAFEAGAEFDLLLTDAVMPDTDTEALIAGFRQAHPRAPVVVCSGYVREELIQRGIAAGEYDFIAKPFIPEELTDMLAQALEEARLRGDEA